MRALIVALATFAIMSFSCAAAWSVGSPGDPFSADVTGVSSDPLVTTSWIYTICNSSASQDYSIWLLQIEVDAGASVVSASSPKGWTASIDAQMPNLVTWFCTSGYLQPQAQVTGFSAVFACSPIRQGWTVMFDNAAVPGDTPVVVGEMVMPEPGSAAAMLAGLACFAGLARRRRN